MKARFVPKGTGKTVIGKGRLIKKPELQQGPKKRGNKYV